MIKNNHTPKGNSCLVDPIRNPKDIENIKKHISNNTRDLLLFCLSINNGLRMSDILHLTVNDVCNLKVGEMVTIKEKKTGKNNVLCLNKSVHKILRQYIDERRPDGNEYLFISKKGTNRPLTVSTVGSMIKSWCKDLHIVGNYSSHSLRKTWGFHQRTKYGVGMELLMKRFNHSSMSVTLRYVGIQDKDVNDLLLNEI